MLEVAAGILIGISFSLETLGFYFRGEGARLSVPAVGYSIHVQVATLSRIGTFMGLPMLGWMLDKGYSIDRIIIAPITTSIVYICICFLVARSYSKLKPLSFKLFLFFANRVSNLAISTSSNEIQYKIVKGPMFMRLYLIGSLSYFFVISGVFGMIVVASVFNDYRATFLQLTPTITAMGTLLSVLFFDPRVSRFIDMGYYPADVIKIVIYSRVTSVSLLFVMLFALFVFAI